MLPILFAAEKISRQKIKAIKCRLITSLYHFVLSQQLLQPSPFPFPLNSTYEHEYFYQRTVDFFTAEEYYIIK